MAARAAEEVSQGMSALGQSYGSGDDGYDPWKGELLGDRYRVLGRIGSGGASHVYVAEHVHLARRFAVKIMHDSRVGDPVALQRFMNEGKVAGRLGHPNIVEWTDMGFTASGVPYLVMELLEGKNLEEELLATGPFAVERAARIGGQIASALAAAHGAGIIHRDLKTSNVIILANDLVKVLDFGISKMLGSTAPAITLRTRVVGTPQYMAPEQLLAPAQIGERTDVYALGVILYELVTGHTPFAGLAVSKCLELIVGAPPPSLQEARPDLPPEFVHLVERALAKDPQDRPENMSVLRVALDAFTRAEPGDPARSGGAAAPKPGETPVPPLSAIAALFGTAAPRPASPAPRIAEPASSTPLFVEPPPPPPSSPLASSAAPSESAAAKAGAVETAPRFVAPATPARLAAVAGPGPAERPRAATPVEIAGAPPATAGGRAAGASAKPAELPPNVAEPAHLVAAAAARRRDPAGARILLLLLLLAVAGGALAFSHALLVDDVPAASAHRTGR